MISYNENGPVFSPSLPIGQVTYETITITKDSTGKCERLLSASLFNSTQ